MIECDNFPSVVSCPPHGLFTSERGGGEKERRGEREKGGGRKRGNGRERDRIFIETTLKGVGMDVPMLET